MAERDLDAMLRRMSQTKVNRRSFLGAAGLTGAAAALAACSGGADDQRRAERGGTVRRGIERSVRRCPVRGLELRCRGTARERAVHVQLEPVHRPGQLQSVPGRVRRRHVPVRHLREQRGAARQARGRRRRLRHRVADGRIPAGHGRGGLHPEARREPDPEPQVHQREVQEAVVGSDGRIPRPEGLGDHRHPVPREAGPESAADVGRVPRLRQRRGTPARRSSSSRWAT